MGEATAVNYADVQHVRATLEQHFPGLWPAVDVCLSTCATLLLRDNVNPTAVILVGGPGTGKTTVASMFEGATIPGSGGGLVPLVYRSDNFTPASFVSQAANRTAAELDKVDLLPRIKDKVLLTPELAPIFRGDDKDLIRSFSIITRVLDGQGYTTDSGTHGQRGHVGRHLFGWIGCTTPFEPHVWRIMSQLGSRLFFLLMETGQAVSVDDLLKTTSADYAADHQRCREAVHLFLRALFAERGGVSAVVWIPGADHPGARAWLARCATLLAVMRSIPTEDRDGPRVSYRVVTSEDPRRAFTILTNVARGHATVHGRSAVDLTDIPLIARVTLSSMPIEAGRITRALIEQERLTVAGVQGVLGAKSPATARRHMAYMHALGVAQFDEPGNGKTATLTFRPNWAWCASAGFRALLRGEPVSAEGLCGPAEPVTPEGLCASPITKNLVECQWEEEEGPGEFAHIPGEMTGDVWTRPLPPVTVNT